MLTKIDEIYSDAEKGAWKILRDSATYIDLTKVDFISVEPILLANDDGTVVKRNKIDLYIGEYHWNTLFSDALMYKLTNDPKYMVGTDDITKRDVDDEESFVKRHMGNNRYFVECDDKDYITSKSWIDYCWTRDENGNLKMGKGDK